MSPEKLAQLRRQRELVQQHLDWLDAEIAGQANDQSTTSGPTTIRQTPAPETSDEDSTSETPDPVFQPDPVSAGSDAKRGCLILFFVIVALITAVLCGIYFWKYRDRPLLFSSAEAGAASNTRVSTV